MSDTPLARQILGTIDLTALGEDESEATIRDLAAHAVTPHGAVAALCIWPRFIGVARKALAETTIPLATVTNFPDGSGDIARAVRETEQAIVAGADEIDVVFPYRAFLGGDRRIGRDLVRECRAACGSQALLKVILETGQLAGPALIRAAAIDAVDAGAQFLKTSTGKTQPGATLEAARILIEIAAEAARHGQPIGFKASGGVRNVEDAEAYLRLFEDIAGQPATARHFRIGASSLLKDVVRLLDASSARQA